MSEDRNHQNRTQPLAQWEPAREFVDPVTGITIRITKRVMPLAFQGAVPLYHYAMRIMNTIPIRNRAPGEPQKTKTIDFFNVICQAENGRATIEPFAIGRFASLLDEAESWIQSERQAREDAVMEQRIQRETKQANFGKHDSKPGLKTLSKQDAAKRVGG